MNVRKKVVLFLVVAVMPAALTIGCNGQKFTLLEPCEPLLAKKPAPVEKQAPAARPEPAPPATAAPTSADEVVCTRAIPTGQESSSILLTEKRGPREITAGGSFDYSIRLSNLTKTTLENVTLAETLPDNFTLEAATRGATRSGNVITWNVGTLGPQASQTFVIRGKALRTGALQSCSRVGAEMPGCCLNLAAVQPSLRIVKVAPAEALLCDPIVSKITVTNAGSGTARNVVVQDLLPEGMTTTDGKRSVTYRIGDLAAGRSQDVSLQTRAMRAGRYANKATATADGGLSADSNEVITAVRTPVLKLVKTAPETRYIGRPITYTLTVTNTGDTAATDTSLTDVLPAGVRFVSASGGGKESSGRVSWSLGSLAPRASITVSVTVVASRPGTLLNTATATARCTQDSARATTAIEGIAAILLETVDLEDPIEVGSKETYVVRVTNQGTSVGTNIVIRCTLPPQQEFVSADAPARFAAAGKVITFAPLAQLAPKAVATYKIVVKATGVGDVRFRTQLTSDQMTSPVDESESTHIYR